ncbi:hypothetical protein LQZ19_15970 [Treponema primitia]
MAKKKNEKKPRRNLNGKLLTGKAKPGRRKKRLPGLQMPKSKSDFGKI